MKQKRMDRRGWMKWLIGGVAAIVLAAGIMVAANWPTVPVMAEEMDMIMVEAEQGTLLGGAKVKGKAVEGITKEGDGVQVELAVPETGFYDVVIRSASIDGSYKENYVAVDGERIGVSVVEGKQYQDSVVERVYLEAGTHTVAVTGFWCWIRIDAIGVKPSEPLPADLFDIQPTLVDPDATEGARRLMTYLCDQYGKSMISGQVCEEGPYGTENACIWRATGGEYPAVLGLDMIDYTPSRAANGASSKETDIAIDYWDKGGIVTFCWHWNAPEKYIKGIWWKGFYTDQVTIDLAKIMNGQDPEGYDLLMRDIDTIAGQLRQLQDAGVPVLWRPLHEASGGWFWWGAAGPEAYKQLYITLYDRLVNVHGLHNLIWLWNGQDGAWYPGDEYVDIIGEDIYPGEKVYTSQSARFLKAMRYTDARKMIVLSENGCLPDPDLCFRDGTPWGFFCTWQGEFVAKAKGFNDLSEQYTEKYMVEKVYASDKVINRSELPDLKNYPLRGE